MDKLLTIRGYAKHRGVHYTTVAEAVANKKITGLRRGGKVLIDPNLADAEWTLYTQQVQGGIKTGPEPINPKVPPYLESRAIKEAYLSRLAKLDFETKSGLLVEAKKLREEIFGLARQTRNALLDLPSRLAADVRSRKSDHEAETVLRQGIIEALQNLEDYEPKHSA